MLLSLYGGKKFYHCTTCTGSACSAMHILHDSQTTELFHSYSFKGTCPFPHNYIGKLIRPGAIETSFKAVETTSTFTFQSYKKQAHFPHFKDIRTLAVSHDPSTPFMVSILVWASYIWLISFLCQIPRSSQTCTFEIFFPQFSQLFSSALLFLLSPYALLHTYSIDISFQWQWSAIWHKLHID